MTELRQSVTQEAIEKIRELIASGEWGPGTRLPREADLAAQLGLSRSSLREAVRALSLVRVLDVRQGDGTYVSSLEPDLLLGETTRFATHLLQGRTVLELFEVRRLLEPAAAAIAAIRIDEEGKLALRRELDRRFAADDRVEELVEADSAFHEVIARAGGNAVLRSLCASISGRPTRFRWRSSLASVLDVLIRGGRVIDGAGNPWFRADVGIAGDRIVSVGPLRSESARRGGDAGGLFVCPGFVDMHTHSDLQLLVNPAHEAKVHQGVTLEVLGQDGLSYAPVTDRVLEQLRVQLAGWNDDPPDFDWSWRTVGEYLDRLDEGIAVNAAYLVPHGTLRMCAMGLDDRAPSDDELAEMKRLLAEGLEQGGAGLSAGLTY